MSDRQLDVIFEGGNMVPYENVYIRKTNLQKTTEINEENFWTTRKSYEFQERSHDRLFFLEEYRRGANLCWTSLRQM